MAGNKGKEERKGSSVLDRKEGIGGMSNDEYEKDLDSWTLSGESHSTDENMNVFQKIKDESVRVAAIDFLRDHFDGGLDNYEGGWLRNLLIAWENWKDEQRREAKDFAEGGIVTGNFDPGPDKYDGERVVPINKLKEMFKDTSIALCLSPLPIVRHHLKKAREEEMRRNLDGHFDLKK